MFKRGLLSRAANNRVTVYLTAPFQSEQMRKKAAQDFPVSREVLLNRSKPMHQRPLKNQIALLCVRPTLGTTYSKQESLATLLLVMKIFMWTNCYKAMFRNISYM